MDSQQRNMQSRQQNYSTAPILTLPQFTVAWLYGSHTDHVGAPPSRVHCGIPWNKICILPTHIPHLPLIDNYNHLFNHRDKYNTHSDLTLYILSYCDNNTLYIVARTLTKVILQMQISLDRTGNFSLVTKLGNKHKKCNVGFFNHESTDTITTFTSTTWSYDHDVPHRYNMETQTQYLNNY